MHLHLPFVCLLLALVLEACNRLSLQLQRASLASAQAEWSAFPSPVPSSALHRCFWFHFAVLTPLLIASTARTELLAAQVKYRLNMNELPTGLGSHSC